jgi:hypothetical protein
MCGSAQQVFFPSLFPLLLAFKRREIDLVACSVFSFGETGLLEALTTGRAVIIIITS